jgi:peptide methionine sulfoxide reductase msrA/msrB
MLFRKVLLALLIAAVPNIHAQTAEPAAATENIQTIVLGAGCFWGVEKRYQALPGVLDAESGYADGQVAPNYRTITHQRNRFNPSNHAEVVKVTYNANAISAETLIQAFYEQHDPTQGNRQGNDIGTQYRSIILTTSSPQAATAERLTEDYQDLLTDAGYGDITTQIKPLEQFFSAEEYHQDYLAKNPDGYCPDHSTGVRFDSDERSIVDNEPLLTGKQIVIVDAEFYCPYCEKFKAEVANDYQGSVPMSYRFAHQLTGLTVNSPTWATPTIIFLEDGTEVFAHQGFLSSEDFYRALGAFKLGQSEAYNVAFNEGTDAAFCKAYDLFKDTPDGQFVDALSGAALFDTRDRFNSSSGWLSFTKPVDGSVTEHADNRYGMRRTELRSASTGIHLGHVFDDGPNGQLRYCINATVLEFIPR